MPDLNEATQLSLPYPFLSAGGKMGKLLRSKNFSATDIGTPDQWPQSLRTTIGIVLNSGVPMMLFWQKELFFFTNDACSSCLKFSNEDADMQGLPVIDVLTENWLPGKSTIKQVLATGQSITLTNHLIPIVQNGVIENTYFTLSCSAVNDESQRPGGVLVIFMAAVEKAAGLITLLPANYPSESDIKSPGIKLPQSATTFPTVNESIRSGVFIDGLGESEKKFRNTVLQAPVGIMLLRGSTFIIETANKIFLDVIGKTEAAFIGMALFDILPEVKENVEAVLINIFTTGELFNATEFPVPLKRFGITSLCYFNFSCQVLKEDDGAFSGIIVIAYEVTDMVNAKYSLAESEKYFRDMVMQSPVPMAILRGKEYLIEIANTEILTSIWRKENYEVLGKGIFTVFPELKEQKYSKLLKEVYNSGKLIRENESVVYVKGNDGMKKFYIDFEYAPLFKTDGSVSAIMVTANNITAIVETRQRLELEEKRLRLATEGTRLATWDLNLQTNEIIHSGRLAEIFGHDAAVKLSHVAMRIQVHPDDLHEVVQKAFEEAMATSIYNYEARVVWHDTTIHWIKTQGKVLYSNANIPLRLLGTTVDITQNKADEWEIARLAAIVLCSKDAIISENMEGIITSWNEAAERMFGYGADEIVGRSITTIIPPDRSGEEAEILEQIERGLPVYSFETRRIKKDGSLLDISLTISPVKDVKGTITGASKIARDITKQKQIEIQIIASEERFRLLANSMAQLIWTADSSGNFNYYNQAVYNYSGMNFEQLQNEGWLHMVHPDDRKENFSKWKQSINTGEDFILEHRFKRYDGEYRWQLSRALPQKDSNGIIQMWVGTSTDIHEIKENEELKDYFISMASHELKTPVTSIKGYVQILMTMYEDKGDDFLYNSLEKVNKQIINLTTLIVDLLDLSKIKSGSLQLNKEYVDINELITEIVKEIQHTQPDCVIEFTGKVNALVFIDAGRIGQVLINLLTNAIKYSPNCKQIKVSSRITKNELIVSVTDAGIGISKTDQQKIFQRFYRVSGKDEKTFPGFGIGLFIASQIIERHNGKMGVESEPGKGAVFYFSLPLNNYKNE